MATEKSTTELDITIGDIRLTISPLGLIGLHRGVMDEHITLVASEAVTIARVLLERLAGRLDVPDAPAGSAHGAPDWRADRADGPAKDPCVECEGEGCERCDGTGEEPDLKQPTYQANRA